MAESAGEEGLALAHGSEEVDVLVALRDAEAEEVGDRVAVEGDGGEPGWNW
jgi:hypothetical protein